MVSNRHCEACGQVKARCFCQFVVSIDNISRILILQHPSEVKNAKNTAGLLGKCLKNSQTFVGEIFSETFLHSTLYSRGLTPLLLYPPTTDAKSLGLESPPELPSDIDPKQVLLVVIDATWRKSRKMLYLNRPLQGLARLSLDEIPPSQYRIRKADGEHQLSTFEATCYALSNLAPEQNFQPLINAFGAYIDHLASFYPHAAPKLQNQEDL
ncbi:MAG: tRNA-uridine aminocarboxypropyltransferase [Cellvibrio sp.]